MISVIPPPGSISKTLSLHENRLRAGIRNLESLRESTLAANSRIRNVDIASESAQKARYPILEQIAIATQVQANISASRALDLLR